MIKNMLKKFLLIILFTLFLFKGINPQHFCPHLMPIFDWNDICNTWDEICWDFPDYQCYYYLVSITCIGKDGNTYMLSMVGGGPCAPGPIPTGWKKVNNEKENKK